MSFGGGDPPAPTPNESTAERMQAFINYYPQYLDTQLSQAPKIQNTLLQQAREATPAMNEIDLAALKQFGPEFNRVGSEIAAQNAQSQAASDLAVLQGSGKDLLSAAKAAEQVYDPEYFATRNASGARMTQLLDSFGADPYSLSGSERAEIERSLGGNLVNRGGLDAPSAVNTLGAANTFGSAVQAKRDAMSEALKVAQGFLQTARSGTDVFQVATGKPSSNNQGASRAGAQQTGSVNQSIGNSNTFMGGINDAANIGMGINANRRNSWDMLWTGLDHINNYVGTAGSMAGGAAM